MLHRRDVTGGKDDTAPCGRGRQAGCCGGLGAGEATERAGRADSLPETDSPQAGQAAQLRWVAAGSPRSAQGVAIVVESLEHAHDRRIGQDPRPARIGHLAVEQPSKLISVRARVVRDDPPDRLEVDVAVRGQDVIE